MDASVVRLPTVGSGVAVVLADVADATTAATEVMVSRDGGSSWTITGLLPPQNGGAPIDLVAPDRWLAWYATTADTQALMETTDQGQTWHPVRPQGLPPGADVKSLSFPTPTYGWALVDIESTQGYLSGQLFATADAGATWTWLTTAP